MASEKKVVSVNFEDEVLTELQTFIKCSQIKNKQIHINMAVRQYCKTELGRLPESVVRAARNSVLMEK